MLPAAGGRRDNRSVGTFPAWHFLLGLALFTSCHGSATHGDGGVTDAGGPDGGLACGTVSACGGDIVGTWTVTQSCLTATEDLSSNCAGLSADISFSVSGTATYNADHSYTAMVTGGGTTSYHYPSSCIPAGATCVQLGQALMGIGMYSSVTCTIDSAGVCNCVAVTPSTSSNETGTYSTSGTTLTTTPSGAVSSGPYCVHGNVLYQMSGAADGGVSVMGSIVLTRQ